MAKTLADAGTNAVYSYAGRTAAPVAQPLPTQIGGFGGVAGLLTYLATENITHIIDATHPFAAGMSRSAFDAATQANLPLTRLERAPWVAGPDDDWTHFTRLEDIPRALPETPSRVFLAIGKQQLDLFASQPQHHYLLRLVDAPETPLPLPNTTVILARGPFASEGDTALLRDHKITHIIAKNAGGTGAIAKLHAARTLGLPVLMADRPKLPSVSICSSAAEVMAWLHHSAERGV